MPDLYLSVSEASHRYMNVPSSPVLPDIDAYIAMCRDMYALVESKGSEVLDYAGRTPEFHSFGVVGAPGGETLAPMFWAVAHFTNFMAMLTGAKAGLVISAPATVVLAASALEQVYTANTTSLGLMTEVLDTSSITNVTTLPWDEIRTALPPVDLASVVIHTMVDEDVCRAVVEAVKPGGLLILTNASNASELYLSLNSPNFADSVHTEILNSGDFTSYHFQGYTSFTCFRKNN